MVGIKIPGSFVPGTVDGFVTEARWIKGTYIVVNTLDEANAIPEGVRVDGTLIYDLETGFEYRRESDAWVIQAKSFADAPEDGKIYARQNGVWTIIDVDSIENSMQTISDNLSKLEQQVNEGFQDVLEEVDTKLESYVPRSELSSYAQIELYTYPDAPAEPGDENTLYFIKTVTNGYDFKIWWPSTNSFVTIGSTEVNLDDYYTKSQVDTKLSELEASIPDTSNFATKADLSSKADTNGTYPDMTVGNATNATNAASATTAETATNATHATNADKATSDVEGNAILSTYARLTALNEISSTLQEVQETANEAEAIARGKATSYTFETLTALDDWLEVSENVAKLHIGDNLYINDVGVPDYWWNGEARMILESEKPDMSDYYSKDEIDTRLIQKANTSGTYSSMSVGFATSAQTAENATHATSADTATSATTAQSATTAESATNATNAVNATTATNAGHATTADSATKATQDGDGNVISTTYVKVNQIPSAEITKQDIADALGCTTSQLDTIVTLAQKITVSGSEIVSSVRVTAPEFNDN